MAANWEVIKLRSISNGRDGYCMSVIDGSETDAELREMARAFAVKCPNGQTHPHCPFHILGGLTHTSLGSLLEKMSRRDLQSLFELERQCRNEHARRGGGA